MKIEIQGQDAVAATEALLAIKELEGYYQIREEVEQAEVNTTLVTVATIVAMSSGTLTIADKLYQWNQEYQKSLQNPVGSKIEKVLIVAPNGRRLLLKDATVEQIQEILED